MRAALPFIHPYHQRPSHGMLVVVVVVACVFVVVVACVVVVVVVVVVACVVVVVVVVACVVVVVVAVVVFIQTKHPSANFELTPSFDDRILGLSQYRVFGRS